MAEFGAVASALGTELQSGLTAVEAASRLARDGPNELRAAKQRSTWRRALSQLQDPLVALLLVAAAIALLAWWFEGRQGWPMDAMVIARVQPIPSSQLVRSDVMVLAEGDAVGADARLLQASSLQLLEASLTGESEAVLKDAATLAAPAALGDRLNMVFKGTAVAQGSGRAVVTATGMQSEVLAQLFNCFNARSESVSAWHGLFANHWLWGAVALSALLQVAVVHVPLLNSAFGTVRLDATQWGVCIGMASLVLWLGEVRKMVHRAWIKHGRSVVAPPSPTSA